MEVARARLKSYDEEIKQETRSQSTQNEHEEQRYKMSHQQCNIVQSTPLSEVSHLAKPVQDSIAINRLPVPEPTVFNGDPIQFLDWKA